MAELWRAPSGQDALTAIFRYLSIVADLSADALYTVIETQAPDVKEALMTLAEQWMAQGEAKGRAEGEAKGRAVAVLAVLEARQKVLTAEQRAKVETCTDLAVLDAWLRKAATLNDTRELFERPE
jgi:predicted transposase YdaD